MKFHRLASLLALAAVALVSQALSQPSPDDKPSGASLVVLANGLHYQRGEVVLKDGLAKLMIPENFRYLGPEDSETVLVKIWGNPPTQEKPLGMLFPAELGPIDAHSWAVVISYEAGGYVKDTDADKINYNDLLKDMQKATAERSVERVKEGYESIQLLGWAATPHYDKAAKKLYWAKELQIGDGSGHTLNYDIRILGRRGMLVLTGVAAMDQLSQLESATPSILSMVEFNQGHRYADFDPRTDQVAAYGIAAVVAGGVAAKLGLFKGLWLLALGAKKFIIMGAIALSAWIKKMFKSNSQES